MLIHPAEQSSVSDLRRETSDRAKLSFSFFVRNVLGLRRFSELRCCELQGGFAPRSDVERRLLLRWLLFRDPKLRPSDGTSVPLREANWLRSA